MRRPGFPGRSGPGTGGGDDPFTRLGLPASATVSDDDVRSAWRRVAAATHPDREDGGDPERFALAAAAYTALRTPSGRGELLADAVGLDGALNRAGRGRRAPQRRGGTPVRAPGRFGLQLGRRVRNGRPGRLAARLAIVLAVGLTATAIAGLSAAALGVMTGTLIWLIRSGRADLGPPS